MNNRNLPNALFTLLLAACAWIVISYPAAKAALTDSTGTPIAAYLFGNQNYSGDVAHADGLQMTGWSGSWAKLDGNTTNESSAVSNGYTFRWNVGGAAACWGWSGGTTPPPRDTYTYVNNPARYEGPVPWQIEGLTPGKPYDIILYGTARPAPDNSTALLSISGFDAGNGVGNPVTLDSEGDGNFQGVIADARGFIAGTLDATPGEGRLTAIQIAEVPPPASVHVASWDAYGHTSSGGIQSGDVTHTDGLQISGVTGDWGTLPPANTSATQRQGTYGAYTFTFNVGGAEMISAWTGDTTAPPLVRDDYYYINNPSRYSGPVPWRVEGLTPGTAYDIIIYASAPALVSVSGFDAGNGTGNPATLDAEGDANFAGAVADAVGQINGWFDTPAGTSANFYGVQVAEVPGGPAGNLPPVFTVDPIIAGDAIEEVPYSGTLADKAFDLEDDPLTFAKVSGPGWLSVAPDGTLSGTAVNADLGLNIFRVSVSDGENPPVEAELRITVKIDIRSEGTPVAAFLFGNETYSGDVSHSDGLEMVGWAGPWAKLNGNVSGEEWDVSNGCTFRWNIGGAAQTWGWSGGTTPPPRNTYSYVTNPARYAGPVPWRIEGLEPGRSYDLILYGTARDGENSTALFAIPGFDAGNGVGNPVTLDSEGDGNFLGVVADGSGQISGTFDGTTAGEARMTALQIALLPPTATDPDESTVVASPASVPADGTTPSTITVTCRNAAGGPVEGREVILENTGGPGLAVISPVGPVTTDANGVATFTVTCKYVGTEEFTATDVTGGGTIVITQKATVEFKIVSQTSLIGIGGTQPPNPDAPQTSLIGSTVAAPTRSPDLAVTVEEETTDYTPTENVIRVTEYYLTAGDFSGTTTSVILEQALASDYFILVRGSRADDGRSMPDNDYARVVSVPGGRGGLADSGATDAIGLQRAAAEAEWEGVVTVVECLAPANPAGFKLVDAVVTTLSGTSGSDVCAPWTDAAQVVPFGGYRGGGVEFVGTPDSRYAGTSAYVRLNVSGDGALNWERDGGGETLLDATMTTFVVEWGSEWTVQHAAVAGSNGDNGADEAGEYTTAEINPVARANTLVWGTGIRADAGIGDCAESCLVTLGDGVTANATESSVAVGSEYTDAYSFDVYALTHPGLAVDHRFKPDGDRDALDLAVPVNAAPAGARLALIYNGCSGTSSRFPRPRFWSRYSADDTVTVSRGYDGADFPAWIQGIDFSGMNLEE